VEEDRKDEDRDIENDEEIPTQAAVSPFIQNLYHTRYES
jgi:hypothetical protein